MGVGEGGFWARPVLPRQVKVARLDCVYFLSLRQPWLFSCEQTDMRPMEPGFHGTEAQVGRETSHPSHFYGPRKLANFLKERRWVGTKGS